MKIEVRSIIHRTQRYDTLGDWWWEPRGGTLHIRVSRLQDERAEAAIAVHEIVEALLCTFRGVTAGAVDAFDFTYEGEGEPGDQPEAPYHAEHVFATSVEKAFVGELGLSWDEYEALCAAPNGPAGRRPERSPSHSLGEGPERLPSHRPLPYSLLEGPEQSSQRPLGDGIGGTDMPSVRDVFDAP